MLYIIIMEDKNTTKEPILSFTKKDFKIEWFNCSGAGGQHKNKHANACRIRHIESGLVSVGQDHKSRVSNQRDAFNRLVEKLLPLYMSKEEREISNERIRTYHEPRNVVTDHASGFKQEYKKVVDNADIGDMIEARRKEKAQLILDKMLKDVE